MGKNSIHIATVLCMFAAIACGDKKSKVKPTVVMSAPQSTRETAQKSAPKELPYKLFPSAAAALVEVVSRTKPRAIGFGEFHQQEKTADILSALERFSGTLLPVLGGKASDLIVETWVAEGACGEQEKKVVIEVEHVTERPKETENETIRLLKRAKSLGIQPHILEVECEDYQKVQDADGGIDYLALLELVARRLEDKGKAALKAQTSKDRLVAIYGGAIHNDAEPAEMWKTVSFAPLVKDVAGDEYVEVDLYVPEFIENSKLVRDEPWFPLFKRIASKDKAALIELGPNSFIIVFRKGVESRRPGSGTKN